MHIDGLHSTVAIFNYLVHVFSIIRALNKTSIYCVKHVCNKTNTICVRDVDIRFLNLPVPNQFIDFQNKYV